MKLYNLLSCAIVILLFACFLFVPQKAFALDFNFFNFTGEDDYQVLSEFESKKILQNFPDILYEKWILLGGDSSSNPMEQTVICLIKYISTLDMFNYFFRDLPLDVSYSITKEGLDMARIIGTEDTSGMIGKLEKGTVNIAVNYLKEYFSKNQIKVSFGAMEMKYKTESGDVDNPLQYIIMYKRIDDKRSKVVARIYSPKEIIPPSSRASNGAVLGFVNTLDYGEKISPFVVEINGIMDDGLFGSYFWDKENTTITTVFPETVPDFGLKPKTWQQKYITDPIKNTIDSFSGIFKFLTGSKDNLTEYVFKDSTDKEAINQEVESISSNNPLEKDYPVKEIKEDIVEQKETIKEVVKKDKVEEKEVEKKVEEKVEEKVTPVVCSKASQSISATNIIINEIAWMGTENSANDEWIELKNVSNEDVNLKGWALRDKEDQINIIFDDYTVPRGGFLLLERTDDNTISFKTADLIYKGSLSNSEEELYLFDNLCQLKDFVSGNPKWTAGDSTTRKTMERDDDLINWHTYSGGGNNGIWGTPREINSVKKEAMASVAVATSKSTPVVAYGGGYSAPTNTYCSQSNLSSPNTTKVIINEIAWMGTENSANDEWIELKNVSNETINLNGWQLLDAENIKVIFNSSDVINPQGFYLLERTDDDSVLNISMNKSYTGALSNSDETLRLFDSNCQLMDEALASPDWLAGDNTMRKTMEREDDLVGWHTYYSVSPDSVSGLWGTPMATNSIEVNDNEDDDNNAPPDEGDDPSDGDDDVADNNHLLITEVKTGEDGGTEYVEIYNQTADKIELCPNENDCFYLSYYSSTSSWYDPSYSWKFPEGAVINSNSYYIIDIYGDSGDPISGTEADWKVEPTEGDIYEPAGSLSIFSNNPKYIENEENINLTDEEKTNVSLGLKVDTVSWKRGEESPIVKEGEAFNISETGKVIERKWFNREYQDTNNNLNNFQLANASLRGHSPKPPEKVQDLLASINTEQRNSVVLTWTDSLDEDTDAQDLIYEIYYSRNNQIDDSSLVNIDYYVSVEIINIEGGKKAVIKDLFYGSEYYFKVRAYDLEENPSPLSESVSFSISKASHQKKAPYYDFRRSGHSQFNGPVGSPLSYDVVIEGNQANPPSNDFTSTPVIDENGTIYFWGSNYSSYDFYAFNSLGKKWSIHCSGTCGVYPALGSDGTIYLSGDRLISAVSPSGKTIWEKEYSSILTKAVIVDSKDNVYFLASKDGSSLSLFSISSSGLEEEHSLQGVFSGSNPSAFAELVIDDSDVIYFSLNDFVVKYSNGTITKKQLFPIYESTCPESFEVTAAIGKVNISFDGTILVNVNNGDYIRENETLPALHSLDGNLSEIKWSKSGYSGPIGFNEEEFYYSRYEFGTYPMIYYLGAANISNGVTKWERRFTGVTFVASDPLNRIYFTNGGNVLGYDSSSMPENLEDRVFHLSPSYYYGEVVSIGEDKAYFSDLQRVYSLNRE